MLAGVSLPARADVISPEQESLGYRYALTLAVDRVDQFCARKGINDPCRLPGSPFEGGGPGDCRREVNRKLMKIDLTCKPRHAPVIDRQVPESAEYLPAAELCANREGDEVIENWLAHSNISCDPPAQLPADRFCRGKRRGDACQVEALLRGRRTVFAGRCAVQSETISYYQFGDGEATREVLACLPAKGMPVHHYQPVSFFRNLLLLL